MLIAIDAGHYRDTPGRRIPADLDPGETREWELNRRVADKLQDTLRNYDCRTFRVDDPTGEKLIYLKDRVAQANRRKADFYLSIHHNAGIGGGSGGGTVVYVAPGCQSRSRSAQKRIYTSVVEATGLRGNRSTPMAEKGLYVLKHTTMPAVLIECGFMDSASDVPAILGPRWAENVAQGIASALAEEFNIQKKKKEGRGVRYWTASGAHIVEVPAEELAIEMVDRGKRDCGGSYISGGFFGNYKEGRDRFTLPAGHLACTMKSGKWPRFYCDQRGRLTGDNLIMADNGKILTTLVVAGNTAEIHETGDLGDRCRFAVAGIPVVRNGRQVGWDTAKAQGWDSSSLYATWHTFLCLKHDRHTVYAVAFKSSTSNLVASGEGWRKLFGLGFVDAIKLDGGGSFHLALGGRTVASSWGNRRINNVIRFGCNPWPAPKRTLTQGKRGDDVKWLQWELCHRGFLCEVDGSFGPATVGALRSYQREAGLAVDGSCGPATKHSMGVI